MKNKKENDPIDLGLVVERIEKILPHEEVVALFSSNPSSTGGEIRFPWCRVDALLVVIRDKIWKIINNDTFPLPASLDSLKEEYTLASLYAFVVILWVEVGFDGLENFANNPEATVSWTNGIGTITDPQKRSEAILTKGQELYNTCLGYFVQYRTNANIKDDCFSYYDVQDLLVKFIPQEPITV